MGRMKELLGDDPAAYARRTDPATSHAAADSVSDAVTYLENLVHAAITERGERGATWDELGALTGLDKASISPRFKPLRKKGLIHFRLCNGEAVKRPGKSGRGQMVWFATREGAA